MQQMQSKPFLSDGARLWLLRSNGPNEIIRVVPSLAPVMHKCYELYIAYETNGESLGRILFDEQDYWIYDGNILDVYEQEQVAAFIINYVERI
jgi:hypothetical protein